jgi:hypothetical protein
MIIIIIFCLFVQLVDALLAGPWPAVARQVVVALPADQTSTICDGPLWLSSLQLVVRAEENKNNPEKNRNLLKFTLLSFSPFFPPSLFVSSQTLLSANAAVQVGALQLVRLFVLCATPAAPAVVASPLAGQTMVAASCLFV